MAASRARGLPQPMLSLVTNLDTTALLRNLDRVQRQTRNVEALYLPS